MILSEKWVRELNNADKDGRGFTFAGALEDCYLDISFDWNNTTRKQRNRYYDNTILPALKNHDTKLIKDYTVEDFDDAIQRIIEKGYTLKGEQRYYSDSTINTFRNMIYRVVYYSSVLGYCNNIFWGTYYELDLPSPQEVINEHIYLKKSLELDQDKRLFKELFKRGSLLGEEVGLCLMYSLGLRNAEAAGLNYGDIVPLQGYEDIYVARIYKTTIPFTNKLQSSGKTLNSGRMIPVPKILYNMLQERKKHISDLLLDQGSELNINDLPIACRGDNYAVRCSADDITDAAKRVFQNIGITSKQLAYIDADLRDSKLREVIREKDPTAYLLRRNYATYLYILQLDISEIQYLMGHDIENEYETRNDYNDPDRIYRMFEKIKKRPLFSKYESLDSNTISIHLMSNQQADVIICGKEPYEKLETGISLKSKGTDVDIVVKKNKIQRDYSMQVPIEYII